MRKENIAITRSLGSPTSLRSEAYKTQFFQSDLDWKITH